MPGIVGIVHDTMDIQSGLMDAMYNTSSDSAPGNSKDWALSEGGEYFLRFCGVLYEEDPAFAEYPAEELLRRWRLHGTKALCDLNGEYLIVIWSRHERKVTLVNDRLGLRRLHLWHYGHLFAWASELKSLLVIPQVRREIDEQALTELLMFGHFQENRTLLKDVQLLPPASCLTWQAGRISISRYWEPGYESDLALEDPDRAAEEMAFLLDQAVRRRLNGRKKAGLMLSGGLDSRSIAGFLKSNRPQDEITTWTTGHGHDHDSRFAKQIARKIGSRHQALTIPKNFLEKYSADYTWRLDGRVSADGCHRAALTDAVRNQTDVLFNGFLGDVLLGTNLLERALPLAKPELLEDLGLDYYSEAFHEELLKQTLRPDFHQRIRGLARAVFGKSIRDARVEHPADRLSAVTLSFHLLGDSQAQVELLSQVTPMACPFVDRDFVDFVLRLPLKHRLGRAAYIRMICKKFPELAKIPRAGDGLPLVRSRIRESLHWKWLGFYRHHLPRLSGGRLGGHEYFQFVHRRDWTREFNRSFIEQTVEESEILDHYFDRKALQTLMNSFFENRSRRDLSKCMAALVGFSQFHKALSSAPVYSENSYQQIGAHAS